MCVMCACVACMWYSLHMVCVVHVFACMCYIVCGMFVYLAVCVCVCVCVCVQDLYIGEWNYYFIGFSTCAYPA